MITKTLKGLSHPKFITGPKPPAAIVSAIESVYLLSDICNLYSIQSIDYFLVSKKQNYTVTLTIPLGN